jgi:hypothetical protein
LRTSNHKLRPLEHYPHSTFVHPRQIKLLLLRLNEPTEDQDFLARHFIKPDQMMNVIPSCGSGDLINELDYHL